MSLLEQTQDYAARLHLEDFVPDQPKSIVSVCLKQIFPIDASELIDGVALHLLTTGSDHRGMLHELLTTRDGEIEPIVHVYEVVAEPGSIRAWVYHRRQSDRLCLTNGKLKWVLYDIRPDSPTYGRLNVLDLGDNLPCRLTIPPYVIHGVKNCGDRIATFVNCPTNVYRHERPDKYRLPHGHPGIPYVF